MLGYFTHRGKFDEPIPVAVPFKAWVCGRSLAGLAGSNPVLGFHVCRNGCIF
jgi:hypothetical protein